MVLHLSPLTVRLLIIVGVQSFAVGPVFAAPVLFVDRAAWSLAVAQDGLDTFDGYDWHTGVDNGKVLAWSITDSKETTLSGVSYRPTGVFYGVESLTYDARFINSQYVSWQEGGQSPSANTLTIVLPKSVYAVAFDFAMFRGDLASYGIALDNGLTFQADTKPNDWNFFGLNSDTAFRSISLTAGLYPVLDNLAWGNVVSSVPEPGSLGLGVVALVACFRQVRRQSQTES